MVGTGAAGGGIVGPERESGDTRTAGEGDAPARFARPADDATVGAVGMVGSAWPWRAVDTSASTAQAATAPAADILTTSIAASPFR